MAEPCRIRIRLPNGAELEAAGDIEYVRSERAAFLASFQHTADADGDPQPRAAAGVRPLLWDTIIETTKGLNIQLRSKLQGDNRTDKDACLVLLAASQKLLNQPKPTAAQLAKWLRASGYPIARVDRAISDGVDKGEILSSGSRRARRYELTGPGRLKAFLLAQQLNDLVNG